MLSKKKKIIIIATMFLLLVVTGYLNIVLNNQTVETTGSNTITSASFFATYRTDRESTRNSEIAYYDAIINSDTSSAEAKATAQTKKESLIQAMETELVTEGLIKSKGFEDVIVITTDNNVNVVVKCAELVSSQVAQIVSIVTEQTGVSLDYIKINPVS